MIEYSQGIYGDGAAILKDGVPVPIEEVVELLNKKEKALDLIEEYGLIDGAHHKQWVLDQLVLILTDDYEKWIEDYSKGEDGPETYSWDRGIAP